MDYLGLHYLSVKQIIMKITTFTTVLLSTLFLFSTSFDSSENNPDIFTLETNGIGYTITDKSAANVYNAIIKTLKANDHIGIFAEVNHSVNAQNAKLNLNYTRTVYFGNPALGTPVMQKNIRAGLDLPQRITVYTNENGATVVAYNSVDYIMNRHGIANVSTSNMISKALATIIKTSTEKDIILNPTNVFPTDGIITLMSDNDFNTTYSKIIAALNAIEPISVFAELDHQANAQRINMTLNPAKLIIFGNPKLGTPLMSASRTIALDLPQKMLVYENSDGAVSIIYNDPLYIAARHGIENNDETLKMISQVLKNISASGASED